MPGSSSSRYSITVTPTGLVAAVATSYFLYSVWRATPDWAKPRLRGGEKEDDEKDANDDLASPTMIVTKLQEMMKIVGDECDEVTPDDLPWYKIYSTFFTLIHLSAEIRRNHPEYRTRLYHEGARDIQKDETKDLSQNLDLADWAYFKSGYDGLKSQLKELGFVLVRYDMATEPGRVGHYVAMNNETKVAVIALKGTSSFSDILTDLLGKPVEFELGEPFDEKYKPKMIRCHEGILTAAKMMTDDTQDIIEHLFLPQRYKILIVGHSLGAGTACLMGVLLRSRLPQLRREKDRLQVVAYATPPVMNYDAASACSTFATSIVNDCDIIPRMSVGNLVIMNRLLLKIDSKLQEEGLSPDDLKSAYAHLQDLMKFDDKTLLSTDELDNFYRDNHTVEDLNDEDNLYVPGRVIALFEKDVPLGEDRGNSDLGEDGDDAGDGRTTEYGCVMADGGLGQLRKIVISTSMITDHFAKNYRVALASFLAGQGI